MSKLEDLKNRLEEIRNESLSDSIKRALKDRGFEKAGEFDRMSLEEGALMKKANAGHFWKVGVDQFEGEIVIVLNPTEANSVIWEWPGISTFDKMRERINEIFQNYMDSRDITDLSDPSQLTSGNRQDLVDLVKSESGINPFPPIAQVQ